MEYIRIYSGGSDKFIDFFDGLKLALDSVGSLARAADVCYVCLLTIITIYY